MCAVLVVAPLPLDLRPCHTNVWPETLAATRPLETPKPSRPAFAEETIASPTHTDAEEAVCEI